MICAGIDAGSRALKIVLVDSPGGAVLASAVADQGLKQDELAEGVLDKLLAQAGLARADVARAVATGYARNLIRSADATVTEITCHARGVRQWASQARTVVEIGGQDSKLLRLTAGGAVQDFSMNDRCAAGTGCFLEVVARRLGVGLDGLGEMARRSRRPAAISSMCVVFAETEIIGLLASGALPEDIVAGVQSSIATRLAAMAGRGLTPPVLFTGGVAMVPGMADALGKSLGVGVTVCPQPQLTGALGAALIACEQLNCPGSPS